MGLSVDLTLLDATTGNLVTGFGTGGTVSMQVAGAPTALAVRADGTVLVGVSTTDPTKSLVELDPTGSPSASFTAGLTVANGVGPTLGAGGPFVTDVATYEVDGKVILAGSSAPSGAVTPIFFVRLFP
jgi:hypothetical protein